jgi:hypothetical protein
MKKGIWIIGIFLLTAARSGHALSWRTSVDSQWPEKPIQIDGRATEWSEMPVVEEGGLAIRAMNDASNLYLLIRGANDDGRILLSGNYRQNVVVWFLKPDHKSKAWGINVDFSHAHPPEPLLVDGQVHSREMISLSDMGIEPEMVLPQGLEVSTTSFPSDFAFQADLSSQHGRQPIFEIQIPYSMVEHKGRTIYFDVVSSEVSPDVKAELQAQPSGGENKDGGSQGSSGGMGGGHHKRGMGGSGGGHGGATAVQPPKPIHLQLTVSLAKAPRS